MNTVEKKPEHKENLQKPKKYFAVIHNDDFSSFDIVIFIAMSCFGKTIEEANAIAQQVHTTGKAITGGPYTLEVCESKIYIAMDIAKQNEMPLKLTIQEE